LEVEFQKRLDEHNVEVSWPTLMRDLGKIQAARWKWAGNPIYCGRILRARPTRRFLRRGFARRLR
jgi:arginine repressor